MKGRLEGTERHIGMYAAAITGTGTEIPGHRISNEELVASFNAWAAAENEGRGISGRPPVELSDAGFIEKASGIRARRVLEKEGVLDPGRMTPWLPRRGEDELSLMAEFGSKAARRALEAAGLGAADVDMTVCAASHMERPYPAISIEIQKEIGAAGTAFDMGMGCSSAAAALHVATALVRTGAQRRVLVVSPEILTGHLDFRDRQTHFIFGDAATAFVVGRAEEAPSGSLEILDTASMTEFSNAIRSDFGFLLRAGQRDVSHVGTAGTLIRQQGSRVFREVTAAVSAFLRDLLDRNGVPADDVSKFWLHQANARMNAAILKSVCGDASRERAPLVLDRYGNSAAAGAVIAMHETRDLLEPGGLAVFCAFGAGYAVNGALLRKT